MPGNDPGERVIVLAPVSQDSAAMAELLGAHGFDAVIAAGAADACRLLPEGAAALLLTAEALLDPQISSLQELLQTQPPWSELPLIILTKAREPGHITLLDVTATAARSVTLLERPISGSTLLRSVEVARRSRRRQYQVRDLVDRLRTSIEDANAARREAEAASLAKDDFIAALSHELRTPLSPVLLAAAELENDPSLHSEAREQMAMIRRNILLEARLIDDLLDLTRIRRGMFRIEPVPTDIHEVLLRAQEILRSDIEGSPVLLQFVPAAREHHVLGDPARLLQVFWNLIKNALKFTGSGGRVTVRTANPAPGRIAVFVEDNGIGISRTSLERIFNAFDQGELHDRHRFGGMGLGLSISKAIVDRHGGELNAASEGPGKGTTFTVELNVIAPVASREKNEPLSARTGSPAPLRLLLVEDHNETLAARVRLLQSDGHVVYAASSRTEALELAAAHECDVVISDLGLPDGSGVALMREIKQRYGWPGIALSGYGMTSDLQDSITAGFVTHLVKPINIATLRHAIREALVQTGNRELVPR